MENLAHVVTAIGTVKSGMRQTHNGIMGQAITMKK